MRKGYVSPVHDAFELLGSPETACGWRLYRIFPLSVQNVALRGLAFGATLVLPVLILTVLGVEAHCLRVDLSPCFIKGHTYIYFKAGWVACLTTLLFPAILLSALHLNNVPEDTLRELPPRNVGAKPMPQTVESVPYASGHYVPVPNYGSA
jgi:hypothetical protein